MSDMAKAYAFLNALPVSMNTSSTLVHTGVSTLVALNLALPELKAPTIGTSEDGDKLGFTWEGNGYHASIAFDPDEPPDFFLQHEINGVWTTVSAGDYIDVEQVLPTILKVMGVVSTPKPVVAPRAIHFCTCPRCGASHEKLP